MRPLAPLDFEDAVHYVSKALEAHKPRQLPHAALGQACHFLHFNPRCGVPSPARLTKFARSQYEP